MVQKKKKTVIKSKSKYKFAASPKYCKTTPISKMGFTQKASCKAQGIIPRTSKKLLGKKIKSPKYKTRK